MNKMKKAIKMAKTKAQEKNKMAEIDEQILKYFDIKKRLGKGAYGIVWQANDKRRNSVVAVKKIFDAFRNETDAQRTFREIMFLRAFRSHPNVIELFSIHKASNNLDIYLTFEFMESDLHNVIKKGTILKDEHKRNIMCQLFNAIKYIHSGNVIHRDLKPSNVLIDSKCRCKIADFGLARSLSNHSAGCSNTSVDPTEPLLTDYVATRWYRAPEILIASKRYTKGIDMWSLGCILGEMIRGKPLFPGSSTVNQMERIIASLPKVSNEELSTIDSGFGSSLLNQPANNTAENPTLDELLKGASDDAKYLVKSLLMINPACRLTANEALEQKYIEKFRHTISETELCNDVLPPINDDTQLSVPEYRSKLYEIMQQPIVSSRTVTTAYNTIHKNDKPVEPSNNTTAKLSNLSKKRDASRQIVPRTGNFLQAIASTSLATTNNRNPEYKSDGKLYSNSISTTNYYHQNKKDNKKISTNHTYSHSLSSKHKINSFNRKTINNEGQENSNNVINNTTTPITVAATTTTPIPTNVTTTNTTTMSPKSIGSKNILGEGKNSKLNVSSSSSSAKQSINGESIRQKNSSTDNNKAQLISKLKYCKITSVQHEEPTNNQDIMMTSSQIFDNHFQNYDLNKTKTTNSNTSTTANTANSKKKSLSSSGSLIEKRHSIDCTYNYELKSNSLIPTSTTSTRTFPTNTNTATTTTTNNITEPNKVSNSCNNTNKTHVKHQSQANNNYNILQHQYQQHQLQIQLQKQQQQEKPLQFNSLRKSRQQSYSSHVVIPTVRSAHDFINSNNNNTNPYHQEDYYHRYHQQLQKQQQQKLQLQQQQQLLQQQQLQQLLQQQKQQQQQPFLIDQQSKSQPHLYSQYQQYPTKLSAKSQRTTTANKSNTITTHTYNSLNNTTTTNQSKLHNNSNSNCNSSSSRILHTTPAKSTQNFKNSSKIINKNPEIIQHTTMNFNIIDETSEHHNNRNKYNNITNKHSKTSAVQINSKYLSTNNNSNNIHKNANAMKITHFTTQTDNDLVERMKLKKLNVINIIPNNNNVNYHQQDNNSIDSDHQKININFDINDSQHDNLLNSGSNYYEQRLRNLEEKIQKHKMDIKEFFYDNQMKTRLREQKNSINQNQNQRQNNECKLQKNYASSSVLLNHQKLLNTKIPFVRKVESCKITNKIFNNQNHNQNQNHNHNKHTNKDNIFLHSKCNSNFTFSNGDGIQNFLMNSNNHKSLTAATTLTNPMINRRKDYFIDTTISSTNNHSRKSTNENNVTKSTFDLLKSQIIS